MGDHFLANQATALDSGLKRATSCVAIEQEGRRANQATALCSCLLVELIFSSYRR